MITHNPQARRFETTKEGLVCLIDYVPFEGGINLTHTYVPRALEGQGIASALTKYALEYARENHLKIIPSCSFIRTYLKRHPEYEDLVKR